MKVRQRDVRRKLGSEISRVMTDLQRERLLEDLPLLVVEVRDLEQFAPVNEFKPMTVKRCFRGCR
jgi:hypothetical protein